MSTTQSQPITGGPKHVDREKTDGLLRHTRLANEPLEYLHEREKLRQAEMEMFRSIERVAALRRALPTGADVTDYAFQEGPRDLDGSDREIRPVRLSELFTGPGRALLVYHFMTEYFDLNTTPNGDQWLTVTTKVEDPQYFRGTYITTSDFNKLPDAKGWNPTPCSAR